MSSVIQMDHVSFSYGGRKVLDDVSLTIEEGDFLAVLGPNGGGKTTLLKLFLGLVRPERGRVRVLGRPPGTCGELVGYLPQHTHVSPSFPATVLQAVLMGLVGPGLLGGWKVGKDATHAAMRALERVGMQDYADHSVTRLSGGQTQRCFLARAIVGEPRLLLLDEPMASVDPDGRNMVLRLLNELNAHMTIVMVNHDISVLSQGVKSVACVDRDVHLHGRPELTADMLRMSYGTDGGACPVELVTHGDVPHRVLEFHPIPESGAQVLKSPASSTEKARAAGVDAATTAQSDGGEE